MGQDIIAFQRQMLADRVLQAKGILPPAATRALTFRRDPLQKMPSEKFNACSSNRHNVVVPAKAVVSRTPSPLRSPEKTGCRYEFGDEHSVSTATMTTMTHEHGPPLCLKTFKPAVGCIRATEFMIRCFVTRLRSGVTVIKHGRGRFNKSPRHYILKLDSDGEFLTWHPVAAESDCSNDASQEPTKSCASPRSKRSLNLYDCQEVRMALTPDPEKPRFTGSATLREKCDSADAHKSFALIFEHRTLDITAMTADQCKMLTEGFSALCYRLHLKSQEQCAHPHHLDDRRKRHCLRI